GAAMMRGKRVGPETPVYGLLAGMGPFAHPDPRKATVTVAHLMTHTSGLACDDNDEASPGREETRQSQRGERDWWKYTPELALAPDRRLILGFPVDRTVREGLAGDDPPRQGPLPRVLRRGGGRVRLAPEPAALRGADVPGVRRDRQRRPAPDRDPGARPRGRLHRRELRARRHLGPLPRPDRFPGDHPGDPTVTIRCHRWCTSMSRVKRYCDSFPLGY